MTILYQKFYSSACVALGLMSHDRKSAAISDAKEQHPAHCARSFTFNAIATDAISLLILPSSVRTSRECCPKTAAR
jgi:hypothetical protein